MAVLETFVEWSKPLVPLLLTSTCRWNGVVVLGRVVAVVSHELRNARVPTYHPSKSPAGFNSRFNGRQ